LCVHASIPELAVLHSQQNYLYQVETTLEKHIKIVSIATTMARDNLPSQTGLTKRLKANLKGVKAALTVFMVCAAAQLSNWTGQRGGLMHTVASSHSRPYCCIQVA
jgi:hypothetical protein